MNVLERRGLQQLLRGVKNLLEIHGYGNDLPNGSHCYMCETGATGLITPHKPTCLGYKILSDVNKTIELLEDP